MSQAVSAAAQHELLPALRLLFSGGIDKTHEDLDHSGVFVFRGPDGAIRGAILAQVMAGALGLLRPPRSSSDDQADELVGAATKWLRDRGVKVCQAFCASGELPLLEPLARNGFRHVTELVSLRCVLGGETPKSSFETQAERPPFTEAFRAVLLSTHEGTLDCPELNLGRTSDELLADFTDLPSGTTWYLARRNELPAGAAILAPGTRENELELAYLGVVPECRGAGFAGILLTFVVNEAARRLASSLTVGVDIRNRAALQLYRGRGFTEIDRCGVWLAHFS
jgi:ribosomal protein S18 acetylase RimI-like enzyme